MKQLGKKDSLHKLNDSISKLYKITRDFLKCIFMVKHVEELIWKSSENEF